MRRYWLPPQSFQGSHVNIEGDVYHHIIDVCRQNVGSKFEVLGFQHKALLVQIKSIEKKRALAEVVETREISPLAKPRLTLALSLCRYNVMDSVIERSVELGVAEIRPFFSDYSFIRRHESIPPAKIERWKKIIISATQQSGRGDLMPLHEPLHFDDLTKTFNQMPACVGLFAYEGAAKTGLKSIVQALPSETDQVWIFVGSEGGFSDQEVQKIQDLGLAPVTLGDQVLRVETACIALVSVLKYEFGLMKS